MAFSLASLPRLAVALLAVSIALEGTLPTAVSSSADFPTASNKRLDLVRTALRVVDVQELLHSTAALLQEAKTQSPTAVCFKRQRTAGRSLLIMANQDFRIRLTNTYGNTPPTKLQNVAVRYTFRPLFKFAGMLQVAFNVDNGGATVPNSAVTSFKATTETENDFDYNLARSAKVCSDPVGCPLAHGPPNVPEAVVKHVRSLLAQRTCCVESKTQCSYNRDVLPRQASYVWLSPLMDAFNMDTVLNSTLFLIREANEISQGHRFLTPRCFRRSELLGDGRTTLLQSKKTFQLMVRDMAPPNVPTTNLRVSAIFKDLLPNVSLGVNFTIDSDGQAIDAVQVFSASTLNGGSVRLQRPEIFPWVFGANVCTLRLCGKSGPLVMEEAQGDVPDLPGSVDPSHLFEAIQRLHGELQTCSQQTHAFDY